MKIEELDDSTDGVLERSYSCNDKEKWLIPFGVDAKRALVGAGARILFYPTLYNVFRNKIQAEFRWWDQLDPFLLLGAVPFPKDVPRLNCLSILELVV